MKKPEKSRNVRAVKNQIQQIEMFIEKLQALKKRLQRFTVKISSNTENHPKSSCPREIEDAINELHKQLGEFDNMVEEYKHNLDMTVKLQQAMEEYQFWCDDASATIVRVGKYSSECKTTEAVSTLYKQFEKFVWPTIPQQEERISQITELAVRLHGPEEGKKFMEKTAARHNEIIESIKELSNGLMDLEAKLQGEALKEQPDRTVLDGEIKIEETGHEADGAKVSQESAETESELKESGHTPENTNDNGEPVKKTIERFDNCKHNSQNFPEKLPRENQVMSELSSHSQGEYSEMSSIKTITSRSVVETTEQSNTSYCNTQTFNFSSPAEKNTETHNLSQTGSMPQLPPPHATSFSDIQREFHRTDSAQTVSIEKVKAFHELQVPSTDAQGAVQCTKEESFSQDMSDAPLPPGDIGRLAEGELFIEESLSYDEYECASPDDISLPPLSETPESNIIQSETDFDERLCSSSHCQHVNQNSQQSHSQFNDTTRQRTSNQAEDLSSPSGVQGTKFRAESSSFVRSPLTVSTPTIVSNTLSSILKCKSTKNLPPPALSKCHQTVYTVHESFTETQECVHDPNQSSRMSPQADNMHAAPFPLTSEQDPDICKPKTVREEIRLMSGSQASSSPTGRAPNFTKGLSNATVMEGSPVTLEVEVTGFPEPTVTWYRNGQNVTSDEDIELSHKEGNHTLFIQMVTDSDKGLYVVQAINSSGTVSSSAMLAVKRNSCRSVASAFKLDWLSCFGILCVLLWLLYLLLL
ncbi:hypothetical protein GJAV_G00204060 [Gymnothorax javanicus]|nr:hypothetical protein GJAV_G00204060 [Gymnothorax javanicus]